MPVISLQLELNGRPEVIKLDLDENVGNQRAILQNLSAGQIYEPDVSALLLRTLRPGDTFVDIGANIGFFSVLAGKLVGPDGHIAAFEADADNHRDLVRHLELNDLANVDAVCMPVADTAEPRAFFTNADDSGGHALWDPASLTSNVKSAEQQVSTLRETTTLDTYFATKPEMSRPKAIKIDIEGAEELALRGGRDLLANGAVPFVICELHEFGLERMGGSQAGLRGLMSELGYETFLPAMDGSLPKLIPAGTEIRSQFIINLLFSRPERLSAFWPTEDIAHGAPSA